MATQEHCHTRINRWVCERCFNVYVDARRKDYVCDLCIGQCVDQEALLRLINIKMAAEDMVELITILQISVAPTTKEATRINLALGDVASQMREAIGDTRNRA